MNDETKGCAATPTTSTAREVDERASIEAAAKAIYRLFDLADLHPWVEGGNSLMQDEARRYARAALSAKPVAREVIELLDEAIAQFDIVSPQISQWDWTSHKIVQGIIRPKQGFIIGYMAGANRGQQRAE